MDLSLWTTKNKRLPVCPPAGVEPTRGTIRSPASNSSLQFLNIFYNAHDDDDDDDHMIQ